MDTLHKGDNDDDDDNNNNKQNFSILLRNKVHNSDAPGSRLMFLGMVRFVQAIRF